MKLVVQVRLLPTLVQAAALEATLHACNEAATWASGVALEEGVKSNFALREHTYRQVKARWVRRPPSTSSRRPATRTPR